MQAALAHYVGDYGGGLIVTGDALRDEKFHQGELEKALPITFIPQPPPPSREPIAVYLLIDRSNSMSYNSRYPAVRDGERIKYAKEAAVALINQLDDTDYAGVIAFDSEPYVLSHLRPVGEDRAELTRRIERLEPGGGTDFKESLEIAKREILGSGIPVHQVILLTDGDTNRQYHDHDQLMADFDKQHISVSTIRMGPTSKTCGCSRTSPRKPAALSTGSKIFASCPCCSSTSPIRRSPTSVISKAISSTPARARS